jgi:hypothetical protein
MIFYNTGYGYEKSDEGYVLQHISVESKRNGKFIDVWMAHDWLPPDGQRIPNGTEDHFYTREDAISACEEHNKGRAAA